MTLGYPFRTIANSSSSKDQNLDRFIPNRSAMDFDYGHYMVTEGTKVKKENPNRNSEYQRRLAEACNMNDRTRIFAFKNKPPKPVELIPKELLSPSPPPPQSKSSKRIRHIAKTCNKIVDAPDILGNFYVNLLDWGSDNFLSIALKNTVFLWNASDSTASELITVNEEHGPVTSVSWSPNGRHLAIGLNDSLVQIWDTTAKREIRTLRGGHKTRVGSLAWNGHNLLTTGGKDGKIVNNDIRVRSHVVEICRGHDDEVCGLKWSPSGQQLASGGNDDIVCIWDRSVASSNSVTRCLHSFEEHKAAVKALAWCPFQGNLLASGGGTADKCIKLWNTQTGARLNSVDTGSQVCALLWNKNEYELLSSHGFSKNQLILWKYPSMVKMAELAGHTSRVLHMTQSLNGTVATAAPDETLRFWNVFGTGTRHESFSSFNRIR